MEQIFDTVIEFNGHFNVEHFFIGRTNAEPSRLRLRVEAESAEEMERLLSRLLELGCSPADGADAQFAKRGARPLRAGGFLLHHQPPHAGAPRRRLAPGAAVSAWTR